MKFRLVRDRDEENSPNVMVLQDTGETDIIGSLRKRIQENKALEEFFKELDGKKKDKKPDNKITLSLSQILALMIVSAGPIAALGTFMFVICKNIISNNLHELVK